MISVFISLFAIGIVLIAGEILWRNKIFSHENARKFSHIVIGTFAATWAFYLTTKEIQILAIILLCGVFASQKLRLFGGVHNTSRSTIGEPMFALAILVVATFSNTDWIYAVSLMHLSLGDGLAAVIGKKYGRTGSYKLLGHTKTVKGTLTFMSVSLVLVLAYIQFGLNAVDTSIVIYLSLPILSALVENASMRGLDNLLVPSFVMVFLQLV